MLPERILPISARVLGLSLFLLGCESTCPRETEKVPTPYDGGNTNSASTVYETNAWDEPFVDFPAGRRVALRHRLGVVPTVYRSYLAFHEYPFPDDEAKPGFVSESAGNQVLLERVDDEFIRVRNDTCEHFYLRLVATSDPELGEAAGGAGGASAVDDAAGSAGSAAEPGDAAGAGGTDGT
jgi:hypothetical protein